MARKRQPDIPQPVHLSELLKQDLRKTGVYLLYDGDMLVYVGQTRTLKWRLETHLAEGRKVFDSVAFIPCLPCELLDLEGRYIRAYAPKYNDCGIAKSSREQRAWKPPRKRRWTTQEKMAARQAAHL